MTDYVNIKSKNKVKTSEGDKNEVQKLRPNEPQMPHDEHRETTPY